METNKTKVVAFRLELEEVDMLDELSNAYRKPKSSIIKLLIRSEHDKMQGNPKLKAMLAKLEKIESEMKDFTVLVDKD